MNAALKMSPQSLIEAEAEVVLAETPPEETRLDSASIPLAPSSVAPSSPQNTIQIPREALKTLGHTGTDQITRTKHSLPPINKEGLVAFSTFPIHSSYIVKDKIGQGTWGSVHLAVERSSGLERAVKKLPKRFVSELGRFRQEIAILKCLDNPHIVRLYETFEDYANIYMVMECCRGGELFDRVTNSRYLCEATAAFLIHQILSALHYIHKKNICHRDLKPENFLFWGSDDRSPLKLIDFGLAKRFNAKRSMRTKVGTLYYVSPEVLKGSYDQKCDVWSVGVILYLLLSGVPPFNGPTDAAIINEIRSGRVSFQGPLWRKISPLAQDLLRQLLDYNVKKRLMAEDALKHPWFDMFSPTLKRFRLPHPNSMPNLEKSYFKQKPYFSDGGSINDSSSTHDVNEAFVSCCQLSAVGVHSLLCLKTPSTRVSSINNSYMSDISAAATTSCNHGSIPLFSRQQSDDKRMQEASLSRSDCSRLTNADEKFHHIRNLSQSCSSAGSLDTNRVNSTEASSISDLRYFSNLARTLVPRWKKFAQHNQLKRAALRVIAQQLYDGEKLQDLRSLFLALDSSNDGALTAEEVICGMKLLHIAKEADNCLSATRILPHFLHDSDSNQEEQKHSLPQFVSEQGKETDHSDQAPIECIPSLSQHPSLHHCYSFEENVDEDEMKELVSDIALDGSGRLEYSDFLAASLDEKELIDENVMKPAFRVFDRDGDGRINMSELKAAFGWIDSFGCVAPPPTIYHRNDKSTIGASIDEEIQRILENCDRDGDGSINFDDFVFAIKGPDYNTSDTTSIAINSH